MKLRALTRPLRHSRAAALLSKLNGILFPGGGADLSQASQFIATASLAFNTSVAAALAGETFPVWGTCLVRRNARALALAADYVAQGFQTVCICLKLKDETGAVSRLSLGEVLTQSGTAEGEVRALDDHMRSRAFFSSFPVDYLG